jgi:hypothetical protein
MADRHHYGPSGEYLGHTSDQSPLAKILGGLVVGVIVIVILAGLESKDGSSGGKTGMTGGETSWSFGGSRKGFGELPRPSDQGFTTWVTGEQIVENGKAVWRIDPGEVSDLRVVRVETDLLGNMFTATVRFKVYDPVKRNGGNVEGRVRYERSAQQGVLNFVDFSSTSFERTIGR